MNRRDADSSINQQSAAKKLPEPSVPHEYVKKGAGGTTSAAYTRWHLESARMGATGAAFVFLWLWHHFRWDWLGGWGFVLAFGIVLNALSLAVFFIAEARRG